MAELALFEEIGSQQFDIQRKLLAQIEAPRGGRFQIPAIVLILDVEKVGQGNKDFAGLPVA